MVKIIIIPLGNLLDKPDSNSNIVENNNFNNNNKSNSKDNINKVSSNKLININIDKPSNGAKNRVEDIPMMEDVI